MSIKFRLTAMQFLQFFVWGAWLISLGGYMGGTLHFEGGQIGAIFATMGIASLIMPGLTGIIADKWINAERLYGILHLIGAGALIYSAVYLAYNTYVIPEIFDQLMERYRTMPMMTSETLETLEQIMPKMPTIMFFSNLIYCTLFGIIVTAFVSKNTGSSNPFKN